MIKLKLIRLNPNDNEQKYTHGKMFMWSEPLNKWLDFCYTLEDKVRDINMNGKFDGNEKKVYGETAIPFLKYEGQVTYSPHFKKMLPLIKNVFEFKGVRMHGLNDISQTLGCVGTAYKTDHKGHIWDNAEPDLTKLILANDKEGKFTIEII